MILKIAAGVFLGGLALAAVLYGPGWLERRKAAELEARAQQLLTQLTPEEVARRCGTPVHDDSLELSPETVARSFSYQDEFGNVMQVSFYRSRNQNAPTAPANVSGENIRQIRTAVQQLSALPCLDGGPLPYSTRMHVPSEAPLSDTTSPNPTRVSGRVNDIEVPSPGGCDLPGMENTLRVEVKEAVRVRVHGNGEILFDEEMPAGTSRTFSAIGFFAVGTSSPKDTRFFLNDAERIVGSGYGWQEALVSCP